MAVVISGVCWVAKLTHSKLERQPIDRAIAYSLDRSQPGHSPAAAQSVLRAYSLGLREIALSAVALIFVTLASGATAQTVDTDENPPPAAQPTPDSSARPMAVDGPAAPEPSASISGTSDRMSDLIAASIPAPPPQGPLPAPALSPAASPRPSAGCASAKPVIVDTAQFASLYRVMNAVAGAVKSEWETTDAYVARRESALNSALATSPFKCPRFVVRVPIVWKFDADTGLMNTYSGGFSAKEKVKPSDLRADLGPNTGGIHGGGGIGGLFDDIYVGESRIEAEFDFNVSRYNAAPRPKTAASIAKCLQGAMSYPGMYGYELRSRWCLEQRWHVELRVAGKGEIPGSFNLTVEEAKRLRATGVFVYLDVMLNYNYIGVDEMMNQWLMFSSLNDAWIGDASGAKFGIPAQIPEETLEERLRSLSRSIRSPGL